VVVIELADADFAARTGTRYPSWFKADLEVPLRLDPRIAALAERRGGGKDPRTPRCRRESGSPRALRYTRELPGE